MEAALEMAPDDACLPIFMPLRSFLSHCVRGGQDDQQHMVEVMVDHSQDEVPKDLCFPSRALCLGSLAVGKTSCHVASCPKETPTWQEAKASSQ